MSSVKVTVLTPNGRRQNVKVTKSTTILQILEEVCTKHEFLSSEYDLKFHNRVLDISLMFQFSGLPNNCLLEMVEAPKKRTDCDNIILCLQLEDGTRLQQSFKPINTIRSILEALCPDENTSDKHLVAIYMRKEVYGDALQKTSLKSLGITSGRAIIRIIHRNPEELRSQANVYVPPKTEPIEKKSYKDVPSTSSKIHDVPMDIANTIKEIKQDIREVDEVIYDKPDITKEPEKKYKWTDVETLGYKTAQENNESISKVEEMDESEPEPEYIELGERNAVAFSLDTCPQISNEDIPDSFYELTIPDMQLLLRDLRKQASDLGDAPLLTSQLREIEKNNQMLVKLAKHKKTIIRVQFPDRIILQGTFSSIETVATVQQFVKKYVKNLDTDFHLFTIPPKFILPNDLTLLEANCVPASLLHFGITGGQTTTSESYLTDEVLSKLSTANGAIWAASKSRGIARKRENAWDSLAGQCVGGSGSSSEIASKQQCKPDNFMQSTSKNTQEGKIPKWFKAPGK